MQKKLKKNFSAEVSLSEVPTEVLLESLDVKSLKFPYDFYEPNGKVEEFIKLVGENKTFVCLFSAANGVGKTSGGANILAQMFWGKDSQSQWFNYPFFKDFPYPKRGRIVSDPTTVQGTLIPELKKWFPPGKYTTSKAGKNYEYIWQTNTGFSFELMTYEQDVSEFEAATLGFCWFDEPPPLAIFKATVARMRKGGIIFITATPLMGSAWMYDEILTYKGDDGNRDFIEATVEANCKTHGVRGILNHSDIVRMVSLYNEEDKQARVFGKFQHLVGLVFKNFNRKVHVIRPFPVTKKDFVVYEALDPHGRTPDAVLWVGVDRLGRKIVVDELYGRFITKELASRVITKADRFRIGERWADPFAFLEDQHQPNPSEHTLASELTKYGLMYQRATKDRKSADRKIQDALDYEMQGGEMILTPELFIFDTCERTIWEIEHYQWDDWRGKAAERKDPKETPMDKDDHMIENLGRILVQNPVFAPMPSQEGPSHPEVKTRKSFDVYA